MINATTTILSSSYIITTDFIAQLIFGIVFPLIVIGLGVKFFRNFDKV